MTTTPVDEEGAGDDALSRLDAALVASRAAVATLRPWSVPTRRLADVLVALEGVVRVAQAAQVAVVGEVASRGEVLVAPRTDPATAALRAHGRAADGRLALAGVLGVHPATAARRQATLAFVTGSGLPPGRVARTGGQGTAVGRAASTAR